MMVLVRQLEPVLEQLWPYWRKKPWTNGLAMTSDLETLASFILDGVEVF